MNDHELAMKIHAIWCETVGCGCLVPVGGEG